MKEKLEAGQITRTPEVRYLRMRMTPSDNSRNYKLNRHMDSVPAFGLQDAQARRNQVEDDDECLNKP